LALRSKIVLSCAEGHDTKTVAEQLGCARVTVGKWRARFVEHRLDGLTDEQGTGRPATITIDQVEDVAVATLESTPPSSTHWSRVKMAQRTGLSKTTIGRSGRSSSSSPTESIASSHGRD
jgi:transposase